MTSRLRASQNPPESSSGRDLTLPLESVGSSKQSWPLVHSLYPTRGNLPSREGIMSRLFVTRSEISNREQSQTLRVMDTEVSPESTMYALQQSEKNFIQLFQMSPAILCIIQLNNRCFLEINQAYVERTGFSRSEVVGKTSGSGPWRNLKDRELLLGRLIREGSIRQYRSSFLTKAGESLTVLLSGEIMEFGGESCAMIAAEDIGFRVRAEEERLQLNRRLSKAQETERARVARELHDNIGQSLAVFSLELEKTRKLLAGQSPACDASLKQLSGKIKALGHTVSNLSHQLHSSELELLGLSVAVKGLCREFSEQYPIQVNCVCSGIPDEMDKDVALGLFRVMQEALHNVAKHSQAETVSVDLRVTHKRLCLTLLDDGIGFAPDEAQDGCGLGLVSMRERMRLIGGDFTIISHPGSGTRIEANVPNY